MTRGARFWLGFSAMLVFFLALNLIAAYQQSDCGIRAVIALWIPSLSQCADDIVRIGFPFVAFERGGFLFRSVVNPAALTADVTIALSASVLVGLLARRVPI